MKIIIVSGSFIPAISARSFRTTELVKELSRLGHSITLYVPKYDYDYTSFLKEYKNVTLHFTEEIVRDKKVKFSNDTINHKINRILRMFFEYPDIQYYHKLPRILKNESNYDLLISIAVPHPIHWAIGKIYKTRKIAKTWIADCGDPYMGCETDSFKKFFYFKYFEKLWCKKADYITIPEIAGARSYYPEFRAKIVEIPQGFDFTEVRLKKYEPKQTVRFAYAGAFIKSLRDPRPILDYLSSLNDKDFKFIIYTSSTNLLNQYTDILNDKLEIRKAIPRLELLYELSEMDFVLNITNGDLPFTPSKIIDYTLTGRPILSINSQRFNDEKKKLDQFLNRDYSEKTIIDIEQYNIKTVAQKFLELCKS